MVLEHSSILQPLQFLMDIETCRRPPDQYVVANKTAHCIQANEYDRNLYAECNYIGNRTLMKCKQVRLKDDLVRNGGLCERHEIFAKAIKRRYTKDKARLTLQGHKRLKYRKTVRADDYVCEEEDYLLPAHKWTSRKAIHGHITCPEDDRNVALRNAGVYTEKEILRIRMKLVEKEIQLLEKCKEINELTALTKARTSLAPDKIKRKRVTLEGSSLKYYAANRAYHMNRTRENVSLNNLKVICEEGKPSFGGYRCFFGKRFESDENAVPDILDRIIAAVAGERPFEENDFSHCRRSAVPGTDYCRNHSSIAQQPLFFPFCDRQNCTNIVLADKGENEENLCPVHGSSLYCWFGSEPVEAPSVSFSSNYGNYSSGAPASLLIHKQRKHSLVSIDHSGDESSEGFYGQRSADSQPVPRLCHSASSHGRENPVSNHGVHFGSTIPSESASPVLPVSVQAQLEMAKSKKDKEVDTLKSARCRPFSRDNFPPKAEKLPGHPNRNLVAQRQTARSTIPFNLPAPRHSTSMPSIPRPQSSSTNQSQYRPPGTMPSSVPVPSRQMVTANGAMATVSSASGPARPTFTRVLPKTSSIPVGLIQRRQLEEDQKAAASILDNKDGGLMKIRDGERNVPVSAKSTNVPADHRYVVSSPRRQARVVQRIAQESNISPAEPPQSNPNTSGSDSSRSGNVCRPLTVFARVSASGRQSDSRAPPIDLSALPPDYQDRPIGDVLKGNYHVLHNRRQSDIVDIDPPAGPTIPFPPSVSVHSYARNANMHPTQVPSSTAILPPPPSKSRCPSILRKSNDASRVSASLPLPRGFTPSAPKPPSPDRKMAPPNRAARPPAPHFPGFNSPSFHISRATHELKLSSGPVIIPTERVPSPVSEAPPVIPPPLLVSSSARTTSDSLQSSKDKEVSGRTSWKLIPVSDIPEKTYRRAEENREKIPKPSEERGFNTKDVVEKSSMTPQDPLSLLADVSASMASGNSAVQLGKKSEDEEEHEEEL